MFEGASEFTWASSLRSTDGARSSRRTPSRRRNHSHRHSKIPRDNHPGESPAGDKSYNSLFSGGTRARAQRLPLPDGWTAHTSRSGESFYHNATTGHSQWHWPAEQLPPGWDAAVSKSTGAIFYHNIATGHTQYAFPVQKATTSSTTVGPTRSTNAHPSRTPRRRELRPTQSQQTVHSPDINGIM